MASVQNALITEYFPLDLDIMVFNAVLHDPPPGARERLPSGPPAVGAGHGLRREKNGALPHSVGLTTILFFENGFGDHGVDPFITIDDLGNPEIHS